jgi:hypothetical protein
MASIHSRIRSACKQLELDNIATDLCARLPATLSDLISSRLVMTEERQQEFDRFIDKRLATVNFDKYRLPLIVSNEDIVISLGGELRNIVLRFFKGGELFKYKRCESCGTSNKDVQYERAHDRSCSRTDVALAALRRIRPDETKPIHQSRFMRAFIEEHKRHPIWYLCKTCHNAYDKKRKTDCHNHIRKGVAGENDSSNQVGTLVS